MKTKLTQDEVSSIQYYWKERGNPSRWIGFEEALKRCPELEKVWNDYRIAKRILSGIIEGLEGIDDEDENNSDD